MQPRPRLEPIDQAKSRTGDLPWHIQCRIGYRLIVLSPDEIIPAGTRSVSVVPGHPVAAWFAQAGGDTRR